MLFKTEPAYNTYPNVFIRYIKFIKQVNACKNSSKKRVLLAGIIIFLLFGLNSLKAQAAISSANAPETELWENTETGYCVILEDDAALLSQSEKEQLSLEMQAITDYGNVIFKSIDYNPYSTSYFAEDFYHERIGTNSGCLFLIDMDNREIYIFSDGAVYKTITSSYADTITDNVYRYASKADYFSCALRAFAQIHTLLSGQKIAQPMKYISNLLLALILAALINYFVVRISSGTAKPSDRELLQSASTRFAFTNPQMKLTHQSKVYSPPSNSSGGGGSRSGGGGGGRSGGGGGHRF
ncbi:TPM domain-containing protein [Parablautia muri]|uniref:TPM domain-containing protein n=1 Tax=Parablautia muri TaxID=2320879 RepID=A0A9X5BEV9_9FIRM|nr:TPM domain-containing protein [Parablautia muri]NBJ92746.1 TPM domain-containing protein [Parablautia muri]